MPQPSLFSEVPLIQLPSGPGDTVWSKPDGNLASGESLIRQILHRQNQLREEGALEAGTVLPDVFGESAALPQILRQAGVTCFLTPKNPAGFAPSFWWEGLDGSRVLTKTGVAENTTPIMETEALPVWMGEFPRDPQRATNSTPARQRKGDRKSESLLHDAEFFNAIVSEPGVNALTHAAALDRAWKLLLVQRADGFSEEAGGISAHDYVRIASLSKSVLEPARAHLAGQMDTSRFISPIVIFNSCSFAREEVISRPDGAPIYAQVPACGCAVVEADELRPVGSFAKPVEASARQKLIAIDNGMLRLIFDRDDGAIRNLRDHRVRREVLESGRRGNVFQLHLGHTGPVEITALQSIEVIENTPLRATVRCEWKFDQSRIVQKISLCAGSPRIDFDTEVAWQENGQLKVAFPFNVRAPHATYDIPFGQLEHPTHFNHREPLTEVELRAQKWADLSEGDYGVALLNDSKFGCAASVNVLQLNLLSSGKTDTGDDRGPHQFTYALLPHLGDFRAGAVVQHAYALTHPLGVIATDAHSGPRPARQSFFQVDRPGVIIETVKRAAQEDAFIVRIYEAYGTRGPVTLATSLPVKQVFIANLREEIVQPLELAGGEVTLPIAPFEIVTLKFV